MTFTMSGEGCDPPSEVLGNVSYSSTHPYEMPTANSSIRNQESPLPKAKHCSTLCCHSEKIKNKDPPKWKIYLISVAIFIAVGIALIVGVAKLHAEVLLQSIDDQPTSMVELPASNWTNRDMANNNCLENITKSKSIQQCFFDEIIATVTGNRSKTQNAFLVDVLKESGYPPASCAAVQQRMPSSPSGYYHVRSSNGSAVRVYCDMTRSCGGITGGWMRVAELDLTDNTNQCPSSLELITSPRRTCRIRSSGSAVCSSDTFTVGGVGYSKLCGRIRAYQVGNLDAFSFRQYASIDSPYVDGVSLTHRTLGPRQHIWTFAGAARENDATSDSICACINTALSSSVQPTPSFVGEDYFCDTGVITEGAFMFHADDPLWDGAGCGSQSTCCSFNTPPWFYKQLPQTITDDIEMRVCRDGDRADEDIAIEVVEIYVQ